mgnify:CR=1 FL=1
MKFSVIVPVYNVEPYLEKCIVSILAQTYRDFELILVDDGSPDRSPQICDAYARKDGRITVIHKKNGGLVSARQAGVAAARGEFSVCVDGDDWIDENYLKAFANVIDQFEPDLVYCGHCSGTEDRTIPHVPGFRAGLYRRQDIEKEIFPILIEAPSGKYFPPMVWAKAIRARIYRDNQLRVDPEIIVGEDHAVTKPSIFEAGSMYILKDCLYYYRFNPDSMTKSKKPFRLDGPERIGKHFEKTIDMSKYDFQEQVYRHVTHNTFNTVLSQFNRAEENSLIEREIRTYLQNPYISNAIRQCKYKTLKGRLAKSALKYKLFWAMRLYSKIHHF